MKWIIVIVILALIISFYIIIKRQNEYNKERAKYVGLINTASQFGAQNIAAIQEQKISPIDQFINSEFVTVTSGIFGKIWGTMIGG